MFKLTFKSEWSRSYCIISTDGTTLETI